MMFNYCCFLIFSILVVSCLGQTYINFEPFSAGAGCSGASSGTGYSWIVGECVEFKGNYYLIKYDADNKTATFYQWENETCGTGQPASQRTFGIGGCYHVTWADYGWYYNVNDYAVPSVVVNPGYIPSYGYRETVYAKSDNYCQGDYLMYFYYTNNTVYKNTLQTFQFYCDQGMPFENVCTMGNCISTTMYESCEAGSNNLNNFAITC
ncbi:hypothetical protein PPL_01700 [Heterostelium album PN500]|uniref:Uncharacterized protein n=1 Tax=Heterostelium pallidum (strain ATCC 26659 / Pp 5 / PN500) TaxID=670386 RepID=D3B084_HETP5|nr:hypothetical protein PPL_01700 [Heterostelium album PN500]EFA84708.1 hypothetical protein PPL_01700 [Heterostelium album PN500]|eukprot:XP_020436821.1 hypothetical protein PPL_01700 [Heterostelium album PN500]